MRLSILGIRRNITRILDGRKHYSSNYDRCEAHMNELPVPCGAWEPWYKERQSYYNKILVAGVLWWMFSFGLAIYTGSFYLNWGPPAQPAPPSDMIEECDDEDT